MGERKRDKGMATMCLDLHTFRGSQDTVKRKNVFLSFYQ